MLRERPFLPVLDNFEHLSAASSPVAELLSACPKLKILATGRVPLHVYGEYEFPVSPLAVPDLEQTGMTQTGRWPTADPFYEENPRLTGRGFSARAV